MNSYTYVKELERPKVVDRKMLMGWATVVKWAEMQGDKMEELEATVAWLKAGVKESATQIVKRDERVNELEAQLAKRDDRVNELEAQVTKLGDVACELVKQIDKRDEMVDELGARVEERDERVFVSEARAKEGDEEATRLKALVVRRDEEVFKLEALAKRRREEVLEQKRKLGQCMRVLKDSRANVAILVGSQNVHERFFNEMGAAFLDQARAMRINRAGCEAMRPSVGDLGVRRFCSPSGSRERQSSEDSGGETRHRNEPRVRRRGDVSCALKSWLEA